QDGSYVAEVLIERGYDVTGVARQDSSRWIEPGRFRYRTLDIADAGALDALLAETMPGEIYHMAAIHGASGYFYELVWREALAVNVASVHTCLEHMRLRDSNARLFYPSSLKAFGAHPPHLISAATPRVSDCLYSITKNAAADLIQFYRAKHGSFASIGYYFNHDSPRRPDNYFLPRLAARIAAGVLRKHAAPEIASLDFWCDWGSSREFAELSVDLLHADQPGDAVVATGHPVYAGALAGELCTAAGLPTPQIQAPAYNALVRADMTDLKRMIGRIPKMQAFDVAAWILRERHGIALTATKEMP
ncbi:MAG: NAD-dependent epimerase/dehydratase family protein, partial [Beijerinckiaceae bacterium]